MKSISSTKIIFFYLLLHALFLNVSTAQNLTQTIKGIVQDADSEYPLIGATLTLINSDPLIATSTDVDGNFRLEGVPVGRQSLEVRYLGYETGFLSNLIVTSGKELVIKVNLQESTQELSEVVVKASKDKQNPLNEMASVSARSFSVEETGRYAAALLDPARMAQNFAGVMSSGDDLLNEIVIRGNSPAYVQWRLEGLQIPSPNHFTSKGSSGGGISMLSSSILTNSDLYTGAFPSEIGNVLAGAFDLKLRNGNNEKREYSFMLGALGTEVSMEGPFSRGSKASYLVNYRYSTLALLDEIGLSPVDVGDSGLDFQDLSFKFNFPTKNAGVFSVFGLGGLTREGAKAEPDSAKWTNFDDLFAYRSDGNLGILGLTHKYLFPNQKSYLHMAVGYTYDQYRFNDEFFDVRNNNRVVEDEVENLVDKSLRFSLTFNHKFNAKHTLRMGGVYGILDYKFENSERFLDFLEGYQLEYSEPSVNLSSSGSTELMQGFGQWKYRLNER
ncbi:MAG: carboxypeptidase-like regulatory domain-containing protein, partial [Planctomycetota bacterium]